MSEEMSSNFDVKLPVKRVAYFQTVCPDFIIVLYLKYKFNLKFAIKTNNLIINFTLDNLTPKN
jgi:hypothetical protein